MVSTQNKKFHITQRTKNAIAATIASGSTPKTAQLQGSPDHFRQQNIRATAGHRRGHHQPQTDLSHCPTQDGED